MNEPLPVEERIKHAKTLHDLVIPKNFRYGNHSTIKAMTNGAVTHYHPNSTSEILYQLLVRHPKGLTVHEIMEETALRMNQVHGAVGTLREGGYEVENKGTRGKAIYAIKQTFNPS